MSVFARVQERFTPRAMTGAAMVAVALIPIIRMVRYVVQGTHLQYADYWFMIHELLPNDGGIELQQVFTFRNEHPVVFAKILYLVNVGLSNGSNIVQGLLVVVVVTGILYLLVRLSHDTGAIDPLAAVVITGLAASLLFAPQSAWTFYKGMSGSAWWMANLFTVVALVFVHCDRRAASSVAAALASISYGTGIWAWPAVAVASMVRNRRWYPPLETLAGFALTAVWYSLAGEGETDLSFDELWLQARLLATSVGTLLPGSETLAEYVGFAVIGSGLALAAYLAAQDRTAGVWIGLFGFGLVNLAVIANGRWVIMIFFGGVQGRYGTLAALVWFGWAMMLIHAARTLDRVAADEKPSLRFARAALLPLVIVAVAVGFGGDDELDQMRAGEANQAQLEIALRFGFSDGREGTFGIQFPDVAPRLEALGHYPFTTTDSFDCGLAGMILDADQELEAIGQATGPQASTRSPNQIDFTVRATGDVDLDCVVAVDGAGEVVGAAVRAADSDDGIVRYRVFARLTEGPHRIVGVDGAGTYYEFAVNAPDG